MNLREYINKYGSDKYNHDYTPVSIDQFNYKCKKCGILSILAWKSGCISDEEVIIKNIIE